MGPFPSIINYGGPPGGIGSSIVKPTYFADTITCGDKPPPSAESKLKLADDADQPVLMCPGEKAKYVCNTDGINVRFDEPTTDEYEVACKVKKKYLFLNFTKNIRQIQIQFHKFFFRLINLMRSLELGQFVYQN